MSRPVRRLFSELSSDAEVKDDATGGVQSNGVDLPALDSGAPGADQQALEEPLKLPIPYKRISIFWADGLPDDPRENIENCKLATGATKMMPLETGIMEYFGRTNEEAQQWIDKIQRETLANEALAQAAQPTAEGDPNKPGPQDGTGVNPQKKGSETGMNNFSSQSNKKPDDK
jgi:hypothetical protein